ncbi:MAG: ADP-ribosylglycohydrolase family protein [Hormoscilla sp. GM102CHS1]|nr:ADP-ribosylglycohydrolase family protein [Hormoscilla sp. GM102CHS1]
MRYTIESRFQGAFLGAAVGEMLSNFYTGRSWHQLGVGLNWWDLDIDEGQQDQLLPGWGSQAVSVCKSLIAHGRVEGVDNEATATILPVALFFHEDAAKLRLRLNQLAVSSKETRDESLAIGYCLLQIAQEKLDPSAIVPQIIAYLQGVSRDAHPVGGRSRSADGPKNRTRADGAIASSLAQVQTLLEMRASLETTSYMLSNSIGLALYCFLSTPEDFRLSVMRALRIARVQPQLVAALTGAMSGAYNSLAGIPVSWRIAIKRPLTAEKFLLPCWGVTSAAEIVQLATNLFVAWSGALLPTHLSNKSPQRYAVAAPQVMRPQSIGPDK